MKTMPIMVLAVGAFAVAVPARGKDAMWTTRAPASECVADWSKADATDAEDIAYVRGICAVINEIGGTLDKGGEDDFAGTVVDENVPQRLRREIAKRIVKLVKGSGL